MKDLTEENLKQIVARRDVRYDGRFFFGVKTTKTYCRPICPAKPKPANIIIFKSQAEAEREGYRPCLRCHPDAAPDARVLGGTLNTVSRALRILETESDLSLSGLADKLGITDRHLRRLFDEHLGASPIEIVASKRLHLAYQLVITSRISFSEIAFAVGFQSVRRFNEAFKKLYHEPPLYFRKLKAPRAHAKALILSMPVIEPYDFSLVLAYLKRHEAYGIERVTAHTYERFIPLKKGYGKIELQQRHAGALELSVFNIPLTELRALLRKLKNLFDLEHHPAHLPNHPLLKPNGVRVPGSFADFETIVSIILSQLVSTEQAKAKLKQIIEKYGQLLGQEGTQKIYAFPDPKF